LFAQLAFVWKLTQFLMQARRDRNQEHRQAEQESERRNQAEMGPNVGNQPGFFGKMFKGSQSPNQQVAPEMTHANANGQSGWDGKLDDPGMNNNVATAGNLPQTDIAHSNPQAVQPGVQPGAQAGMATNQRSGTWLSKMMGSSTNQPSNPNNASMDQQTPVGTGGYNTGNVHNV
jgi:hypothetical protein